jgi:hypothetical protein
MSRAPRLRPRASVGGLGRRDVRRLARDYRESVEEGHPGGPIRAVLPGHSPNVAQVCSRICSSSPVRAIWVKQPFPWACSNRQQRHLPAPGVPRPAAGTPSASHGLPTQAHLADGIVIPLVRRRTAGQRFGCRGQDSEQAREQPKPESRGESEMIPQSQVARSCAEQLKDALHFAVAIDGTLTTWRPTRRYCPAITTPFRGFLVPQTTARPSKQRMASEREGLLGFYVSDERLAALVHMNMLNPHKLRAAVSQPA